MKPTVIVVDDNIANLQVAQQVADFLTEVGADVLLTEKAQVAFDLIENDEEGDIIGVVTDLYFPRSQHFTGYDTYVSTVKKCAERVLTQMGKVINDERSAQAYISRLPDQFEKLAFNVEQLPYGGGIALACIQKRIPFIILSDSGRHVLQGQPLDTATMFTPFADMGFVGYECLTEATHSRHTVWAASKNDPSEWEDAFRLLGAQWGEDIAFGKSTWASYCDPNEVRQPKISMAQHTNLKKGKVFGKVSALYDGNKAVKEIARKKAAKVIHESENFSVERYGKQEQVEFLAQVMIKMGQLDEAISQLKSQSKLWLPGEGTVRLPPHDWCGIHYRTDVGLVVATSGETIARARRGGCNDNQLRFQVLVWKFGENVDKYRCMHSITYWDFNDDLEPPTIKTVEADKIVIEQFYRDSCDCAYCKDIVYNI